jgi:hypothetical protein
MNSEADLEHILAKLDAFEKRIAHLEENLGITSAAVHSNENQLSGETKLHFPQKLGFESRIGGYGLALLGNIVLLFGIIFLSQYIQNNGYPFLSAVFGFISAGSIFLAAYLSRKSVTYLSSVFYLTANIMLYYVVLRLHYFTDLPLIGNSYVSLILIFAVIAGQVYISVRKKSQLYACLAILLVITTGILDSRTLLMLGSATLLSAGTVFLLFQYGWRYISTTSLFLIYLTFLVWLIMNQTIQNVPGHLPFHQYSHIYLLMCAGIFSFVALIPPKEKVSIGFVMSFLLINGILFSFILAFFVMKFFPVNYSLLFIIISFFCIIYSIILKTFSKWKFSPAFYAMYGFVAISISVFGIFNPPYIFLLLALQGLFVAIIALWFRSRILVSMNAVLFHLLLVSYIIISPSINSINFTFTCVSLISAWIFIKKKQLLELDSNLLPNIYTVTTFIMLLFSLYKFVPPQYVTLSWTLTAISYFAASILFKNVNYRWIAILTMISTALYLFIVDLSRISIAYRIIAFLFLAIISISISIYYSRIKKSNSPENKDENN